MSGWVPFFGMDKTREKERVSDPEDRHVDPDKVPVPFIRVEFDSIPSEVPETKDKNSSS